MNFAKYKPQELKKKLAVHRKKINSGSRGTEITASELLSLSDKIVHERLTSTEYINHMVAIVESTDDAIISNSLDGVITSWNKGGEKMFGFSASEAIGKNMSIIIPAEYLEEDTKILDRICKNENIDHYETVRSRKNKEHFFVSVTVSPLRNQDGRIVGVSKITRDISTRKKAEAESIASEKQRIFQNEEKELRAAELITANKELVFQNQEKEKRAAELAIANKELLFQNEEKEKRAAELIIANKELAFQNQEKEKRAAELSIANHKLLFQNQEKEKRAAELIIANEELAFQNQEKEKRAAELIIANNELAFQNEEKEKRAVELGMANHELAMQEVKLKKHNKELEQFAYVASHDLQEPLRTVSNYMQVFEEDYISLLDKRALSYLKSVNRATERMSDLIRSLLEFSRLGKNSVLTTVDCKKMLDDVISDLDTMITRSNAEIIVLEMPVLNAYEVEMRQLFQNLIINAIKFQKKGNRPQIEISSLQINGIYSFSVKDNGIGIDSSYFERVFEIFQRLPTSEKYEGNGIGLANCKKIVQLHEGELTVESVVNRGTTFHFTIGDLKIK